MPEGELTLEGVNSLEIWTSEGIIRWP